jgi:hypothetical protein
MDIAKLFFVYGVGLAVIAMPTLLVVMAFVTRERKRRPALVRNTREAIAARSPARA